MLARKIQTHMVINITDTLILHVLKSNYKTNFTIFLFIFAFLKIDSFIILFNKYHHQKFKGLKTKSQKVTDCKTKNGTVALMKFIFNCCNSPIYNIYNPLLFFLVLCLYISTCLLAADKLIPLFHHIASTFRAFLC